jgi:predicted RNA-binding Zn ribbon-like protein
VRVDELPPDVRRRFRTGRPSLDLTHTGGDGELAVWELLHQPADLSMWLGVILGVDGHLSAEVADLKQTRELRRAVTSASRGLARGVEPTDDAVSTMNAFAERPPLVPRLEQGRIAFADAAASAALSTLARDAIDLFASPLRDRIRICAADDCGLLLVDTSRPGSRRWCSMERCGTRAKVRRHRS